MNIEQIVRKKRSLEYAVKTRNDIESQKLLNELINEYNNNLEICGHNCYVDYGYYKYHNNDIYKSNKEQAEFRVLICPKCGKKINLLKTNNINWDKCINGKNIEILSIFEVGILPVALVETEIKSIMSNYYNLGQRYCGHLEFINNGYYIVKNSYITKGNYEDSDFRIVTCNCCKETMLLPKTENENWNSTIDNKPITIIKRKK